MPDRLRVVDHHAKWLDRQVRAAVAIGINVLDAQAAAKAFLALLPPGADPDTYIVPPHAMEQDLTSPEILADARVAWYADENIPAAFKRILDAGEVE